MINIDDWQDYQTSFNLVNYHIDEKAVINKQPFLLNAHKYSGAAPRLVIQGFRAALSQGRFVKEDASYVEWLLWHIDNNDLNVQASTNND